MVNLKIKLPDGFLDEEVRCEYNITHEIKELWAVELDLLEEFDRVCRKHDITYYVCAGTVLGAIRHKGFIPWDDDIDVMLMRKEYDKLCDVASQEFQSPYFFQTDYTDHGSTRGHAQLRNSLTTCILNDDYKYRHQLRFNQGIFIDIFPLDNVPDTEEEEKHLISTTEKDREEYLKYRTYYFGLNYSKGIKRVIKKIYLPLWQKANRKYNNKAYKKFEIDASLYNTRKTKQIGIVCLLNDRFFFDKSLLGTPLYMPFEFLKVPVPQYYDEYLDKTYGDWHKFVKGGAVHSGIIFDTDKPYTEYIKEY